MSERYDEDPPSPCIGVCMMSSETGLCEGCYRTIEEIEQWWDLDPGEKARVIDHTTERQERILEGTFFD